MEGYGAVPGLVCPGALRNRIVGPFQNRSIASYAPAVILSSKQVGEKTYRRTPAANSSSNSPGGSCPTPKATADSVQVRAASGPEGAGTCRLPGREKGLCRA